MRIAGCTWGEFVDRGYQRALAAAPVVAEGWPHQCRCGEMTVVRYRGRCYCRRCGNRWRNCPYRVNGQSCACAISRPKG